ncbi:MAG TPA: sulfotransferase [Terriglobia bacterium]|nr:sulfotransferase [Terriglobia bacterium]
MPFFLGAPRSGTTLLRFMVDAHSCIAIPPETGFLSAAASLRSNRIEAREELYRVVTTFPSEAPNWDDFGVDAEEFWTELQGIIPFDLSEGFRTFYRLYARHQNKPRYGDKTPMYCEHIRLIEKVLPEAHFIHIIRDGRDAALSLRRMWFAPANDIQTLAQYWRRLVENARKAGRLSRRYLEVRYEDLIWNPQPALEKICRFLELDFEPAMLRYWERTPERLREHKTRRRSNGNVLVTHEERLAQQQLTMQPLMPERIFVWKEEMTRQDRSDFLRFAGDLLEELGYEVRS